MIEHVTPSIEGNPGERIKRLREARGMSVHECCDAVWNCSEQQWRAIEAGDVRLGWKRAARLLAAMTRREPLAQSDLDAFARENDLPFEVRDAMSGYYSHPARRLGRRGGDGTWAADMGELRDGIRMGVAASLRDAESLPLAIEKLRAVGLQLSVRDGVARVSMLLEPIAEGG
jgi:hypothetical protein